MKINNVLKLPQVFVDIASQEHEILPKHYSVTEILNGIREIQLTRKYYDELEQDVSDMSNVIFGTAIHHLLEVADNSNITEYKIQQEIRDGYYLTGRFDAYNEETFTLIDYKTASVYKIINGDFDDWHKQGLMYAWLMFKNGIYVDKVRFIAMLKDWSPSKAEYDRNYPIMGIHVYEYKVSSAELKDIENFINERFDALIADEDVLCTEKERWRTQTKYAVMKTGGKRAIRVSDEPEEVQPPYYIDVREGEDKKCNKYCPVKRYCEYWRNKNNV